MKLDYHSKSIHTQHFYHKQSHIFPPGNDNIENTWCKQPSFIEQWDVNSMAKRISLFIPYITTDSSYHFISMAVSRIPDTPSPQPKSVHKHNSNSSIKSALLQYCPAANAKCFKYYKTAKKFSAYISKREKKKISNHPQLQLQGSRGAVSPSQPLYKYLHF